MQQPGRSCNLGWMLLQLAALYLLPWNMAQSEAVRDPAADRFSRLAQIVAEAGENAKQDFSWIAISELTAAYEKVYLSSRGENPQERRAREKLFSWRSGTRSYLAMLHRLLERLPGSTELQIQASEAGPPIIYIDREPVVISGPDIGSVRFMEKRIVDTYCALYDGSELATPSGQQSDAVIPSGAGIWTLKRIGSASYTTPDGLVFVFSGVTGRSLKQQRCEAIAAEMRGVVAGLRDAADAGHLIQWSSLEIRLLAGGRGHRVRFNSAGEYLRAELPLLARIAPLQPLVFSWIKQRTIDERPIEIEILADPLLPGSGREE